MELTDNQKNMVILFTFCLAIIIVAIGLLTNYWFANKLLPPPDLSITAGRTAESIQQEINNYKALTAAIKENKSYLNELLVVKFFKPLFDSLLIAIISYLFAKPIILAIANRLRKDRQQN